MTNGAEGNFWEAFSTMSGELGQDVASGKLREAFQRVDALLQGLDLDFCFELTREGDTAVLVLTPEGDPQKGSMIDALVAAKPEIPGWRVYRRRQRKPLKDALAFVRRIYGLDLSDATFDLRGSPGRYEVVMHSKVAEGLAPDEAYGLVATFLDHAIGEEVVMARVSRMEASQSAGGHFSAEELVAAVAGAE